MPIKNVTDATFESEVLRSELPVLVDLWADWCAPCKQLSPLVDELARELEGKLQVVKVDIDKCPRVAQAFRVQSIPMLLVVAEGKIAGHHVGLLDRAGLRKLVDPVLRSDAAEIKPAELAELITGRRAIAVDVRDANSYGRYRIPGAVHVDAATVVSRARELAATDGRLRVLYGRTTDDAKKVAEELKQKGVVVGFLAGGFLHWEADGLEVERGT